MGNWSTKYFSQKRRLWMNTVKRNAGLLYVEPVSVSGPLLIPQTEYSQARERTCFSVSGLLGHADGGMFLTVLGKIAVIFGGGAKVNGTESQSGWTDRLDRASKFNHGVWTEASWFCAVHVSPTWPVGGLECPKHGNRWSPHVPFFCDHFPYVHRWTMF